MLLFPRRSFLHCILIVVSFGTLQLEKIYGDDADSVARDEDMNRMREHVFTEVDLDQDGMVSLQEFIRSTKDDEFMQDKGWEVL